MTKCKYYITMSTGLFMGTGFMVRSEVNVSDVLYELVYVCACYFVYVCSSVCVCVKSVELKALLEKRLFVKS